VPPPSISGSVQTGCQVLHQRGRDLADSAPGAGSSRPRLTFAASRCRRDRCDFLWLPLRNTDSFEAVVHHASVVIRFQHRHRQALGSKLVDRCPPAGSFSRRMLSRLRRKCQASKRSLVFVIVPCCVVGIQVRVSSGSLYEAGMVSQLARKVGWKLKMGEQIRGERLLNSVLRTDCAQPRSRDDLSLSDRSRCER